MTDKIRFDSTRPAGSDGLSIQFGSPADGIIRTYPTAHLVRVWADGAITAFTVEGSVIEHSGTFTSFHWHTPKES